MNKQEALDKIEELRQFVEKCDTNTNKFFTFTKEGGEYWPVDAEDLGMFPKLLDGDEDVEVWKCIQGNIWLRLKQ